MPTVGSPPTKCSKCGGTQFFDNRGSKPSPKSPDFRCKVPDCREPYWLGVEKGAPPPRATPPIEHENAYGLQPAHDPSRQPEPPMPPVQTTFESIVLDYRECLTEAMGLDADVLGQDMGGDSRTVASIAATLFNARRRQGV